MPEQRHVEMLPLDRIVVPGLRVTSIMDDDRLQELVESIRAQGILQPLQVTRTGEELWLVDGFNRLQAARELELPEVPCLIVDGGPGEVLLHNLVVNRQRGRSNPAEEARLVRHLREEGGLPLEAISKATGISVSWARKLHDVAGLPEEVLALVGEGHLGVSHAMELLPLADPALTLQTAVQAVEWRQTVDQVRLRVQQLLRPEQPLSPGDTYFEETGQPRRLPLPCAVCQVDVVDSPDWVHVCQQCKPLVIEFGHMYRYRAEAPPPTETPATVAALDPRYQH